jgi:hypothetical protein
MVGRDRHPDWQTPSTVCMRMFLIEGVQMGAAPLLGV